MIICVGLSPMSSIARSLTLIFIKIMPNKNLLRFLKPDVKLSSNGFDLSHRDVFSIKAGALNVAMYLPCVQGDYHEISPISYLTTMPFNTANFTRMKQHLDFFFVPYTCLLSRFYEWYQQTTDPNSAIFVDNAPFREGEFIPHAKVSQLVWALCYASALEHETKILQNRQEYQVYTANTGAAYLDTINEQNPSLDLDKYRHFFVNNYQLRKDKLGYPVYLNTIRLLDMLGYGNFLPCIKLPIFTGDFQLFTDQRPGQEDIDGKIDNMAQDFERVFLFNNDVDVSLLNLAAYQAICQNYFINPFYERPDVKSYNFDDCEYGDIEHDRNGDPGSNGNTQLFTINYRPWKKDVYLSALPSPQFGEVSVVSVLTDRFKMYDGSSIPSAAAYVGTSPTGVLYRQGNTPENRISLVGSASVIDIRRAEALQYWREQIGRAGFRYDDRFRATFGDAPGFDPKILPVPIGSFVQEVNKDPVVGTSGDDFGDKRATGSSLLQNEVLKFKAPSFGVIIGLISILPESDYDSFMIDKNNIKFEPFDFFTPALQNLGFVPMNIRELSLYTDAALYGNNHVLGYLPENYEYKTAVDKLHGEFCSMPLLFMPLINTSPIGQFSSFVSSRIDMESFVGSIRQYYVDPAVLDNIFLNDADEEQSSDQFHVSCYFDIKSYRPMSVLGLPQF